MHTTHEADSNMASMIFFFRKSPEFGFANTVKAKRGCRGPTRHIECRQCVRVNLTSLQRCTINAMCVCVCVYGGRSGSTQVQVAHGR